MIARSYVPTEQLSKVREADPALAEAIEKLCRATMALRGPAMMMEANGSLSYAAAALAPFVTMQEAPAPTPEKPAPVVEIVRQRKPKAPTKLSIGARLLSASVRNSNGLPGVKFNKQRGNYTAAITVNNKKFHLGSFATAEEASEAYQNAFRARERAPELFSPKRTLAFVSR